MATLDELYANILADEAERTAFAEAAKTPEGMAAFLKGHGCEATPGQVAEFLKERQSEQGEVSDAELDSVAGGCAGNADELGIAPFSKDPWGDLACQTILSVKFAEMGGRIDSIFCVAE